MYFCTGINHQFKKQKIVQDFYQNLRDKNHPEHSQAQTWFQQAPTYKLKQHSQTFKLTAREAKSPRYREWDLTRHMYQTSLRWRVSCSWDIVFALRLDYHAWIALRYSWNRVAASWPLVAIFPVPGLVFSGISLPSNLWRRAFSRCE